MVGDWSCSYVTGISQGCHGFFRGFIPSGEGGGLWSQTCTVLTRLPQFLVCDRHSVP